MAKCSMQKKIESLGKKNEDTKSKKHSTVAFTINNTTYGHPKTILYKNTTVWDVLQKLISDSEENQTFDGAIAYDADVYINYNKKPWNAFEELSTVHSVSDLGGLDDCDGTFLKDTRLKTLDDIFYIEICDDYDTRTIQEV